MSKQVSAWIDNVTSVQVFTQDGVATISKKHHLWEDIKKALDENDVAEALKLSSVKNTIESFIGENFKVKDGKFYYKGCLLDNRLTKKALAIRREQGGDATSLLKFLDRVLANPAHSVVKELFDFLETNKMPITADGYILAFKKVRGDFKDIHSGKMDNSPGTVVEMERNLVNDNRQITCSHGLHFCSESYLAHYGGDETRIEAPVLDEAGNPVLDAHGDPKVEVKPVKNKVVVVMIDPADVVSIPVDYGNAKGRTCRYTVLYERSDGRNKEDVEVLSI